MIFATCLNLILALAPAALLAAPTQTVDSIAALIPRQAMPAGVWDELRKTDALCDLSNVALPAGKSCNLYQSRDPILTTTAPTPLPAPAQGTTLRHIAIGRGTQNYTCASASSSDVPKAVGAKASLFNATCDAARLNLITLGQVTDLSLNYAIPTSPEAEQRLSGHHQFTAAGVPLFMLETPGADYGRIEAKVDVKSAAPTTASKGTNTLGSVPWLKLSATTDGSWAYKEVYRVHTAGGVAPDNCQGIQGSFTVEYSAQYWFYA
ncbi:malate dehydrogenase [Pyrenophora seminiperda CCB06]|uniref:Malate dehydrogenase n=1 Tax=Pyrenophora seminiperda CCB06 TaxID=1302712 RepID=A0A3M7M2P6_9PLEO|nr:malate dehydrogenase [Pyrenophora seminiperda CCB06]